MITLHDFRRWFVGASDHDIQSDSAISEIASIDESANNGLELRTAREPTPYDNWRIILDTPAEDPKLGFDRYAAALSDAILASEPRFAMGLFGGWGSGKSTLMQGIRDELASSGKKTHKVISVEFNAWRYEKEDHLILPLLDTIQQAMDEWGREHNANSDAHGMLCG